MKVKIWFAHRDGPYSTTEDFECVEDAEAFYWGDPFFICASDDLDYKPPVVVEYEKEQNK